MKPITTLSAGLLLGFFTSRIFDLSGIQNGGLFVTLIYLILGVGLYGSVYGINLQELKQHNKIVLSAVTLGVLFKTLFIAGLFYFIFKSYLALVFAVIVAQIDPIGTVKLISSNKHLSQSGQTIIKAWSSFDDPMTVLLAVYVFLPILIKQDSTLLDYTISLGWNLIFCVIVYNAQKYLVKNNLAESILLIVTFIICVWFQWMLAIAILALFLRPENIFIKFKFEPIIQKLINIVFVISSFLIGTFIQDSVDFKSGIILGILAVLSQIVIGYFVSIHLDRKDRINIALAQYNGITSIILAIFFEEYFDGIVSVIIIALITINILYYFNHKYTRNWLTKISLN